MSAIEETEALLGAMADAGRRADEAMRSGRISYDHRVGWARRNLLEKRIFYRLCMSDPKIDAEQRAVARTILRNAIKTFRRLTIAETRGIDTSVPGWRGGRAA